MGPRESACLESTADTAAPSGRHWRQESFAECDTRDEPGRSHRFRAGSLPDRQRLSAVESPVAAAAAAGRCADPGLPGLTSKLPRIETRAPHGNWFSKVPSWDFRCGILSQDLRRFETTLEW